MRRRAPHGRKAGCVLLLPLAVSLLACGGEDSSDAAIAAAAAEQRDNRPPVIERLGVEPASPRPGASVRAVVQVRDPDADPVKTSYEWSLGGEPVGSGTAKLMLEGASRGDELRLTVVASDGRDDSEPASLRVSLANRPPVVDRLSLGPAFEITAGEPIEVVPESRDPDGDEISHRYRWLVNGEPVTPEGEPGEPRLDTSELAKGDAVRVEVRASDRDDEGEPFVSPPIRVTNRAPKVVSAPGPAKPGAAFAYQVRADDPDGDSPLRFELDQAPRGMEIGATSGEIRWRPRTDQAGRHRVRVVVDDLRGGRVAHSFEVEVGGGADASGPAGRQGG